MNGPVSRCSKFLAAIAFAIYAVVVCPCGGTTFVGFPEDKFDLTVVSDRILLVDVSEAGWMEQEKKEGGGKKFQVIGSIVEDVRGKSARREFKHVGLLIDLEDPANQDAMGLAAHYNQVQKEDSKVFECKRGERYVVIHAFDTVFFIGVSKTDEGWRKRIKDLDPKLVQSSKVVQEGEPSKDGATHKDAEKGAAPGGR
ncbi:MAG: hypothetical protein V4584_08810 [Verrucomicrobiota bacterium]